MILACCPGGSASNLFAYFMDGDVPLSIMLTIISTLLALGFMPLNLWIYTRQWEGGDQLTVPYKSIAITLAWILVPLVFGMLAKRFTPKLANIINQIGSVLGMVLIWTAITLQYIMFPEAFNKGWKLWLIAAAIPTAGFILGYFLAFIARQPSKQRKTISLETGMQSISLATTIVITSFPKHMHGQMTPLLVMCVQFLASNLDSVIQLPLAIFNMSQMTTLEIVNSTTTNSNATFSLSKSEILEIAFYITLITVQITIMLSMGAIITIKDIINHFKRPISIIVAVVSQFIAMPASAYGIINLSHLPPTIALSTMIFATCPGGSVSNLYTHFCGGDVPLSIMLTTISTVLAIGFMPLNMWIYARQWEGGDQLKVPYKTIAITLAWILVPLVFGMLAKRFTPKLANIINKIGSILGMMLTLTSCTLQYVMFPEAFHNGWKLWLISAAISTAGFLLGYFLAFIAGQPAKQRKTISLETGMQSVSLATTIVITSFPSDMHGQMTPIIMMSGVYTSLFALLLTAIFRIRNIFFTSKSDEKADVGKSEEIYVIIFGGFRCLPTMPCACKSDIKLHLEIANSTETTTNTLLIRLKIMVLKQLFMFALLLCLFPLCFLWDQLSLCRYTLIYPDACEVANNLEIVGHFKRPISILVALTSQFVAMPAAAFGIITLADFPSTIALSAMILATCPGGTASNLFTHYCDGDVPLSIMLTTISTVLAIGFMPLNMWIYARKWQGGDQLKIPYKSFATTLAWILVPLLFGMLAKRFTPKLANIINKVGSALGIVFMLVIKVLQYIMFPEAFNKNWKLWLLAAAIPSVGFLLGYVLAFISRQPSKLRKTISIETGLQSVSLATTIVAISFPKQMHGQMAPLLSMCGIYFIFPPTTALSAMILATCPGGTLSNLLTFFCGGDVPLSIMLTTISTFLAIGFMPLNMWIYARQWEGGDQLKVPYKIIAITFAWILVPLFFGMLAKRFTPKFANLMNKIGSTLGLAFILLMGILQYIMYPAAIHTGWKLWLIAAATPSAGFFVGYFLAFTAKQPVKQCKTISIETGMQSVSLATTIVVTSFPPHMHGEMTSFLMMNGDITIILLLILAISLRIINYFKTSNFAKTIFKVKNCDANHEMGSFLA
uniref:Ileal sodium/bile acid cotransporter n=1 Tax=Strigamia maritima TaxID=126957 RepID=T1IHD5_STRMM